MILPPILPECSAAVPVNSPSSVFNIMDSNRASQIWPEDRVSDNGWVVQKFGGTSMGKFASKIVTDIVEVGLQQQRIAIVCSARSSSTKLEGTTSRLARAALDVLSPHSRDFRKIVERIRADHLQAGLEAFKNSEFNDRILKQYTYCVNRECRKLLKILTSAQLLRAVTQQTEDMVISFGEKLSCLYMTALLRSRGIDAAYIDCSEIVDLEADQDLDDKFYLEVGGAIAARVSTLAQNAVPVITGYFGTVPGGLLKQIGRGYTDLCAALVAVGLGARELQVWKEVDGVFTADPRKVHTARLLPSISSDEAAELTLAGSEVIHPFTMDQVIQVGIPVRIKNVMHPQGQGTIVRPGHHGDVVKTGLIRERSPEATNSIPHQVRQPLALTSKCGITVVNIHSNHRTRSQSFLTSIFHIIDSHELCVDLISSSEVHVSMALRCEVTSVSKSGEDGLYISNSALRGAVDDLSLWGNVDIVPNMAVISLVGRQLKSMLCVSGQFFSTLGEHGINIEMISQGASEINISCVIDEAAVDLALNAVHASLFSP